MGLCGRDGPGDVDALELIEGLLLSPPVLEIEAFWSTLMAVLSKNDRSRVSIDKEKRRRTKRRGIVTAINHTLCVLYLRRPIELVLSLSFWAFERFLSFRCVICDSH
jgi:hypothetical protein